jgi:hypothetical protein
LLAVAGVGRGFADLRWTAQAADVCQLSNGGVFPRWRSGRRRAERPMREDRSEGFQMKYCRVGLGVLAVMVLAGMGPEETVGQRVTTQKHPSETRSTQGKSAKSSPPVAGKPGSRAVGSLDAKQTAERFYEYIADQDVARGVDHLFDPDAFARRYIGAGYSGLNGPDKAYVQQMVSVLFKSMLNYPHVPKQSKGWITTTDVKVRGNQARATASRPAASTPTVLTLELTLERTASGWKVIDVADMGGRMQDAVKMSEAAGVSLTVMMEVVLGGALEAKRERVFGNDSTREDAIQGNLRAQVKSIQNQIELYNARHGRYPDLVRDGWGAMVKEGYFKAAPVNPVNNSSAVVEPGRGSVDSAWEYDLATGTFGACFYDERGDRLTLGTP